MSQDRETSTSHTVINPKYTAAKQMELAQQAGTQADVKLPDDVRTQSTTGEAAINKLYDYHKAVLKKGRFGAYLGHTALKAVLFAPDSDMTAIRDAYLPSIAAMFAVGTGAGNSATAQDKFKKSLPGFGDTKDGYKKRLVAATNQILRPIEAQIRGFVDAGKMNEARALKQRHGRIIKTKAKMLMEIDND